MKEQIRKNDAHIIQSVDVYSVSHIGDKEIFNKRTMTCDSSNVMLGGKSWHGPGSNTIQSRASPHEDPTMDDWVQVGALTVGVEMSIVIG